MTQTLSTGLIIAGAYADKVRRVLFAQLRDKMRSGEIENREIARAAAELNRLLFNILVEKLGTEKGDVIRARIDYEIEDGKIRWLWDTLSLEVFKRIPDEKVTEIIKDVVQRADELTEAPKYSVKRLGVTPLDDVVYEVLLDDRRVGALLVENVNGEAIVKGAITEPQPIIVKRAMIEVLDDLDESVMSSLENILDEAEQVDTETAQKVVSEILDELQ